MTPTALASAIRDGLFAKRRDAPCAVIELSVACGDLRAEFEAELALDVLGGPLFYRLFAPEGSARHKSTKKPKEQSR